MGNVLLLPFDEAPPAPARSKTRSTAEAMILLQRWRAERITEGRAIARRLIDANGETHSRAVLQVMEESGRLDDIRTPDYWLGAVFRAAEFCWTGRYYTYSDDRNIKRRGRERNIHERTIKVWTTRDRVGARDRRV